MVLVNQIPTVVGKQHCLCWSLYLTGSQAACSPQIGCSYVMADSFITSDWFCTKVVFGRCLTCLWVSWVSNLWLVKTQIVLTWHESYRRDSRRHSDLTRFKTTFKTRFVCPPLLTATLPCCIWLSSPRLWFVDVYRITGWIYSLIHIHHGYINISIWIVCSMPYLHKGWAVVSTSPAVGFDHDRWIGQDGGVFISRGWLINANKLTLWQR